MSKSRVSNAKRLAIGLALAAAIAVIVLASVFLGLYYVPGDADSFRTVGYVTGEALATLNDVSQLKYDGLTHIIYAFANVNDEGSPFSVSEYFDKGMSLLVEYKKARPDLKLMLSVAGDGFCKNMRTSSSRAEVIAQLSRVVEHYGLDGLDVDWEYPNRSTMGRAHCSHDAADLTAFMSDLRREFGENFILSMAISGSIIFMNELQNRKLAATVDFVNVMTYDLGIRNHCGYGETAFAMFNAYLGGYKKSQLNLGLPLYERCSQAEYDYIEYDRLTQLIEQGKIEMHVKKDSSYGVFEGHRLSFDTREQLMRKVELVKTRRYGGVFCWHMGCNLDGSLMREARGILDGNQTSLA